MQPTDIPPVGMIQGISRKETPYDTEVITDTTQTVLPAGGFHLFSNYTAFANGTAGTGGVIAKQTGRDTNLGGSTASLPQGYQLEWYEWRASVRTLNNNITTAANVGVFGQMHIIRQTGYARYLASQSPLITSQLTDLLSYVDSLFASTTVNASTIITPAVTSRGGKVIAVGGEPYTVRPQEQFSIFCAWPGAIALVPLVAYYLTSYQDGILTRAS